MEMEKYGYILDQLFEMGDGEDFQRWLAENGLNPEQAKKVVYLLSVVYYGE